MPSYWRSMSRGSSRPETDKLLDDWGSPLSSTVSCSSVSSASWPDSPTLDHHYGHHGRRPNSRGSSFLYHIARRLRRCATTLFFIDLLIIVALLVAFEPLITLLRRNDEFFAPRVVLSGPANVDPWDQAANKPNTIPRILHQTAASDVIPEKWRATQASCKAAYNDFEYMVRGLLS